MSDRLFQLAEADLPDRPVVGAIFARHDRAGAVVPLLLVPVVVAGTHLLGWPAWLGVAIGMAAAAAGHSLLTEDYVLVLVAPGVRVHRVGQRWWFRIPLGEFDRELAIDDVRRRRRGLINDSWTIDGTSMRIARHESDRLIEFVTGLVRA